jgi:hypothetical protein
MAVRLWNRQEIDRIEASLYRRIIRNANDTVNAVILNTLTKIPLAVEITYKYRRRQNK